MMTLECTREHEVVTAILVGRWPEQCDDRLRDHTEQCESCRDLVEVVRLLRDERNVLHERVNVPAAGQVWWRAAIRARLEATSAASRPLTWMFGAAGACAVGLAVAAVGLLWLPVERAAIWASLRTWAAGIDLGGALATMAAVARMSGLVALGAVTCIVLASLAFYFALSDE